MARRKRFGVCRICLRETELIRAFSACVSCEPQRQSRAKDKRLAAKLYDREEAEDMRRKGLARQMRKQRQVYQ